MTTSTWEPTDQQLDEMEAHFNKPKLHPSITVMPTTEDVEAFSDALAIIFLELGMESEFYQIQHMSNKAKSVIKELNSQ